MKSVANLQSIDIKYYVFLAASKLNRLSSQDVGGVLVRLNLNIFPTPLKQRTMTGIDKNGWNHNGHEIIMEAPECDDGKILVTVVGWATVS